MRTLLIIYILISFFSFESPAESTFLYGRIKNYSEKKLLIKYDQFNVVLNTDKFKELKTDNSGYFQIEISDLEYPTLYNFIEVKNRKVFFCLFPKDSLCIEFDKDNPVNTVYRGVNSGINYFANDYFRKVTNHKSNAYSFIADSCLQEMKQQFKEDSNMLMQYKRKYDISDSLTNMFYDYLQCDYYDGLSENVFDFSATFRKEASNFNLNNHALEYNCYYYSVISGYIYIVLNRKLEPLTIEGLRDCFGYADQLLEKSFATKYKAYLIGYYFLWPYKNRVRKNPEINNIIHDYLAACDDEILKNEIRLLVSMKKLE